jgi:predicted histidine transporter YuiF (NhaC family)
MVTVKWIAERLQMGDAGACASPPISPKQSGLGKASQYDHIKNCPVNCP